jgi:regulator of replication initiation timing
MKIFKLILAVWICFFPLASFADEMQLILILKTMYDMYKQGTEMKNLDSQIVDGLTGQHNYGSKYYDPNGLSWGSGANEWQSVLAMAKNGGGSGEVGSVINQLAKTYPISSTLGASETENEYYRMQAQTTLASRASSQVAFDELNKEAESINQLHREIDQTKDAKSSADLNNRLAIENSKINIQQAKLMAVLVQQISADSQSRANIAKENAQFLDFKK